MTFQQKYELTEEAKKLLTEHYDSTTETIDMLQARLRVPRHIVHAWAKRLGLSKSKEPPWQKWEIDRITAMISTHSTKAIARALKRSEIAVICQMHKHSITKCQQDGYTLKALCEGLGCSPYKAKEWIKARWLEVTYRQSKRTETQGDIYYITDKAIKKFVRWHPNELDSKKFDWLWLADILFDGLGALGHEEKDTTDK